MSYSFSTIKDAVFFYFAAFYVFNISYGQCPLSMEFLQRLVNTPLFPFILNLSFFVVLHLQNCLQVKPERKMQEKQKWKWRRHLSASPIDDPHERIKFIFLKILPLKCVIIQSVTFKINFKIVPVHLFLWWLKF
jgi:hypothetical protein